MGFSWLVVNYSLSLALSLVHFKNISWETTYMINVFTVFVNFIASQGVIQLQREKSSVSFSNEISLLVCVKLSVNTLMQTIVGGFVNNSRERGRDTFTSS